MTDLEYKRYYIEKNYPENPKVMWCAYNEESDYGRNLTRGDNGRAYGHWQIHLAIHNISYECAMNFECSTDWTINMWRKGEAHLWTGYNNCL